MITWLNGEPVQAKISEMHGGFILTLNRFNNKTKQLEFIDKTGTKYYTKNTQVEFVFPDDVDSTKLKRISDAMKFEKGDLYE